VKSGKKIIEDVNQYISVVVLSMQFSISQRQVLNGDIYQKILHHGVLYLIILVNGNALEYGKKLIKS